MVATADVAGGTVSQARKRLTAALDSGKTILGRVRTMSNAIKFSPPGKQIRVAVGSPCTRYVECQIQDEGPGFSDNDRTRMFRRYGRLSARPTGGEPSTGLGLSIVKKLVLAMHGELACESAPGNGATFAFRLPRATGKH